MTSISSSFSSAGKTRTRDRVIYISINNKSIKMRTKLIFTTIGIIHVFIGGSLLAGVLIDPRGMLEPYFTGELTDQTIQLFAGTADVVGAFNIGIGAMLLIIRIIM